MKIMSSSLARHHANSPTHPSADTMAQGIAPEKPASGKLMLRVPPGTHGAALVAAQAAGKSLNQ
jgi:predicted HicB family RNase H-like nuclease